MRLFGPPAAFASRDTVLLRLSAFTVPRRIAARTSPFKMQMLYRPRDATRMMALMLPFTIFIQCRDSYLLSNELITAIRRAITPPALYTASRQPVDAALIVCQMRSHFYCFRRRNITY